MSLAPKSFLYDHDTATGVATITLNRPDRLNALTFEVYAELRDTFAALDTEEGVRAILLTGAGRGFCSGGDVEDIIGALFSGPSRVCSVHPHDLRRGREHAHRRRPIVAALNGTTAGAGAALAAASDGRRGGVGADRVPVREGRARAPTWAYRGCCRGWWGRERQRAAVHRRFHHRAAGLRDGPVPGRAAAGALMPEARAFAEKLARGPSRRWPPAAGHRAGVHHDSTRHSTTRHACRRSSCCTLNHREAYEIAPADADVPKNVPDLAPIRAFLDESHGESRRRSRRCRPRAGAAARAARRRRRPARGARCCRPWARPSLAPIGDWRASRVKRSPRRRHSPTPCSRCRGWAWCRSCSPATRRCASAGSRRRWPATPWRRSR